MTQKEIVTGSDQVLTVVKNGVAVITLNRPEARNALSSELTPALRKMIRKVGEDDEIGSILLTGAGDAFCSGGDIKRMGEGSGKPITFERKVSDLIERQRSLTGALFAISKPTIAALPGPATGAGLALALACDIRIAAESAFVSTGYARVGLSGDYGIAWLLTRLVGTSRAREFMYTADRIESDRCERLGLFNRVVPRAKLQREAFDFAARLAKGPRLAFALMKENLNQALEDDFTMALDAEAPRMLQSAETRDHLEAVKAFIEKREPKFRGA